MKKLLMFLVLLTVSVGTWAFNITLVHDNSTNVDTYKISNLSQGELADIKNGTGSVTYYDVNGNSQNFSASEFLSSSLISQVDILKVESATLSEDDVKALDMFSSLTTLDLSAVTFTDNSIAGSIKCGSSIETVVLPFGLTKAQVNEAGAALTTCNANFGSCLSVDTELEPRTTNHYWYDAPCTGERTEYTGEVTNGQGYIDNITRPLHFISSSFTYVNTKFDPDEVISCDESNVVDGKIVPNPLKVKLTEVDNPTRKYFFKLEDGTLIEIPSSKLYAVNMETGYVNGENWGMDAVDNRIPNPLPAGTQLVVETTHNYTYTYTFMEGYNEEPKTLVGEPEGDATTGYYTMVPNNYSPGNGYQFDVTSNYNYTYTDANCNDNATITYHDGPHETIDVTYNTSINLDVVPETVNVPVAGADVDVIAYVNTAGSLYKATNLADVRSSATNLIISGNITSDDLAISASEDAGFTMTSESGGTTKYLDDKTYNVTDADKYNTVVNNAFNNDAPITSVDISDATIAPNNLRILSTLQTTDLEEVIFPKNCTRIPSGCLYGKSNVNNIVLPENLESIGFGAFHSTIITAIEIPSSITSIEYAAFEMCLQLDDVRFPFKTDNPLTLGDCVFYRCDNLERMSFPEGLQNIGEYTFGQCVNLHAVRLPNSLHNIGDGAFYHCSEFESIIIPKDVQTIGRGAFDLAPIKDLYLMATTPDELPLIYSNVVTGRNGDQPTVGAQGTFTYAALAANNTGGADYKEDYSDKTNREMYNIYKSALTGGNTICLIHYNPALENFINYNPFPDSTKPNGLESGSLSSTYLIGPNAEGTMWPGITTASGTIPGGTRPDGHAESDYLRAMEAGDPGQPINQNTTSNPLYVAGETTSESLSRIGWRQFVLRLGDVKSEKVAVEKEYKGVWYTMCFPFYMTDEDLIQAFNDGFNICDFSRVSLLDLNVEGVDQKTLILHFNQVASSDHIQIFDDEEAIDVLAKPYRPYMIHPALGPTDSQNCTIKGIYANEDPIDAAETTLGDGSMNVIGKAVHQAITGAEIGEETVSGDFYFIGNVENPTEQVASDATKTVFSGDIANPVKTVAGGESVTLGTKFIPQYAYFLGTAPGDTYPKYWREMLANGRAEGGVWNRYTSIVISDQRIENALEDAYTYNGNNKYQVKSIDIDFSDFTPEDVTAVEQIVEEAKANDVPVQYLNIVYDFNGNIVKKGDASLGDLPTGMYIVNGKKYLVK